MVATARTIYAVTAEYERGENTANCGSPDFAFIVLGTFDDKGEAEGYAAEHRDPDHGFGDFGGKEEWSDCGWWIGVQSVEHHPRGASASARQAGGPQPWGIPRSRNPLKESLMPPDTFRVMYLVRAVPTEHQGGLPLQSATKLRRRLARRGLTAWVETSTGEFFPVKGATRSPARA